MSSNQGSAEAPFYSGPVRWLTEAAGEDLGGFAEIAWPELVADWVVRVRGMGLKRASLESAAQPWLDWLAEVDRLAVVDVDLDGPAAAADLLGFVVEPATRLGIELVIVARQDLDELDPEEFLEPFFGYAYSLERLRWRLRGARPVTQSPARLPETEFTPDPTQAAAVEAGDGTVQIIAPAGSGKTTVLVERVRELRRRGVPADAIACLTFNKAAKAELAERLQAAGVGTVEAFTFHSFGRRILIEANKLSRTAEIGTPTLSQWRRFAAIAMKRTDDGVWLTPAEAAARLSEIKLGLLQTPSEYAERVAESEDPKELTMSVLYSLYEEDQRQKERVDFDDLVLKAVRLLRENEQVRGQWQTRYQHLLVDEYQDIEPAQELIVRIVGAPHDRLFCVGDEDQTLYAFRRASVERIIGLDRHYPALQRVSLGVNYRCPSKIVESSRTLIDLNRVRFPKQIEPNGSRLDAGKISVWPVERQAEGAAAVAKLLKGRSREEVAVLARTTNALRPTALACADLGVPIDGNPKLFEPLGARQAIERHLRLVLRPREATAELLYRVCQTPSRSLSRGDDEKIAALLRKGESFEDAFAGMPAPRRGKDLLAPGDLFELLASSEDAAEAVSLLRRQGGLDAWFEEADDLGGLDQFECEALERAQEEAAERSPEQFLGDLERQAEKLRAAQADGGIELLTIHGAKGRQWPHVVVVACEEGTLPHTRSLRVEPWEEERGEGMEAERRLAYVAFTRAQQHLYVQHDKEKPSPFLAESGILPSKRRAARVPPPVPMPSGAPRGEREPERGVGALSRLLRRR